MVIIKEKPVLRAWSVMGASVGINLALGILYAWSIFKEPIVRSIESGDGVFNWSPSAVNDPYAVSLMVFSFSMVPAGWIQDRLGPRITALMGGVLVGGGMLVASLSSSYIVWIIGFGVMVGGGIGCGYACTTPVTLKWFPPSMTGMAAGIVVAGAGLAPVYIAPLAQYLINEHDLGKTVLIFGVMIAGAVGILSFFLHDRKIEPGKSGACGIQDHVTGDTEVLPGRILRSATFRQVWLLYFAASGAGLMVIGSLAGMAKASMGETAFVAVAVVAIGNALGRIVAGSVSDRLGRENTILAVLVVQACLMFLAIRIVGGAGTGAFTLVFLASFIGFNYGTNSALFPALARDLWGLKNFGANYGMLFTAWGTGGFVMSRISQTLTAATGGYDASFILAGVVLLAAAVLAVAFKKRRYRIMAGKYKGAEEGYC